MTLSPHRDPDARPLEKGAPPERPRRVGLGPGRTVLLLVALAVSSVSCRRLSDTECHQLLSRYLDLLANSDRPDAKQEERQRMHQRADEMAQRDPEFARCSAKVSRAEFECAMAAPTTDAFEQCLM